MAVLRPIFIALMLGGMLSATLACHASVKLNRSRITLTVLSSSGFAQTLKMVAPKYEKASGVHLDVQFISSSQLKPAVNAVHPLPADVVLTERSIMDRLLYLNQIEKSTRIDLARSFIAMAVREGAPLPDISTVPRLRETLLQAKSMASSDSPSGRYLAHWLFQTLHLCNDFSLKSKTFSHQRVADVIARGTAQIGLEQLSKLKSLPGISIVGLIPDEIQKMVIYSGAVVRGSAHTTEANAVLEYLLSSNVHKAFKQGGLEPLHQEGQLP